MARDARRSRRSSAVESLRQDDHRFDARRRCGKASRRPKCGAHGPHEETAKGQEGRQPRRHPSRRSRAFSHRSRSADRSDGLAAEGALAPENQFAAIAYVGIVIAALLSAVSLTVSAISSVIRRRRAFGLMRLTGMPRAVLRKVVSIEAVVPVAGVFLASADADGPERRGPERLGCSRRQAAPGDSINCIARRLPPH